MTERQPLTKGETMTKETTVADREKQYANHIAAVAALEGQLEKTCRDHDCECGEKACLDVVVCPHTAQLSAAIVYCMCDGSGPPCHQFVSIDGMSVDRLRQLNGKAKR